MNEKASGLRLNNNKQKYYNIFFDAVPLLGFIVILAFFSIVTKGALLKPANILTVLKQMFPYILGGFGCLFLFAQGGIDLSMASSIGLCAILGARVMQINLGLGVFVTISVGVVVGLIMGIIYAYADIPVFIQGLAMNFLIKGMLWPLCAGNTYISAPPEILNWLNNTREMIIIIVSLVVVLLVYNFTKFGKECRAIGAGAVSSHQSGVNVARTKVMAFVITGLTCGIVAFLTLIRMGSANQATGSNFNFNVMLCLVLGGCVMGGGIGVKVRNAVIGAATLIVLSNGLVVWGADSRIQDIVKGILFILMIVATNKLSSKVSE